MPADMTLAHIGYVVRRMASAIRRFESEGATLVIPPTVDPAQRVEVCLLDLGGHTKIELIAPTDDPECPVIARLARGGGLDHLCYFVDDLDQAVEKEVGNGAIVVCSPIFAVAFNRDVAFVHRRSGLLLEFMTRHETEGGS